MVLKDGTGSSNEAKVYDDNALKTKSIRVTEQEYISDTQGQAYQVSTDLAITNTEQNLLLLKNSSELDMIITYIRFETIGAATASVNAYFNIKIGGDYSSGGTAVTPINVNAGSSNSATGLFYEGSGTAITTSGTFNQIDRTYKDDNTYNKEGALILPKGSCLLLTHKGSTVAGNVYCRVSFYYSGGF